MARFQSIARDVQLATAGLAPQNIAAALAQFAREELAKAIDSGEGSPDYDIYVNGQFGAAESSVVPPGPILYVFSWWADIVQYALQYLIERSPSDSGRYRASWIVMANNSVVANLKNIPATSEVTLVNVQPYHRKIDVGHMHMRVAPFIIEDARKAVMAIFGNIVKARRTLIQLPGGYVLKGRFGRGVRKHARPGLRPDTRAGAAMTYPALILTMKAGSVGGGGGSSGSSSGGGGSSGGGNVSSSKSSGGRPPKAATKVGLRGKNVYAVNTKATRVGPKIAPEDALRNRIEKAYLKLSGGRRDESVRLSHLRGELSDLDRGTVDAGLGRILKGDKKASLMRHDDPRQLSKADHAAAYNPAGEPFHVIWIAS